MIKMCVDKYLPKNKLALQTSLKWDSGAVITCYFMEGTPIQRARVEREAHKWEEFANIKFVFTNDPKSNIRITFKEDEGSYSYIGIGCKHVPFDQNTMNYGWLFDNTPDLEYARVVIHEFGHALGFIHEHQSPSSNIPWDRPAVYAYYARQGWSREMVDQNIFNKYSETITQFSVFDKSSIMLYAVDESLTIGNYSVGWNSELSILDKITVGNWYGVPRPTTDPVLDNSIVPGGPEVSGILGINTVKEFEMVIKEGAGGQYVIKTTPPSMWINVFKNGKKVTFNKGRIQRVLGSGKYIVRIRHDNNIGGLYAISSIKK